MKGAESNNFAFKGLQEDWLVLSSVCFSHARDYQLLYSITGVAWLSLLLGAMPVYSERRQRERQVSFNL